MSERDTPKEKSSSPSDTRNSSNLAISWPARRFRSNWMAVIVHGVEGLLILALVLGVILGLGV